MNCTRANFVAPQAGATTPVRNVRKNTSRPAASGNQAALRRLRAPLQMPSAGVTLRASVTAPQNGGTDETPVNPETAQADPATALPTDHQPTTQVDQSDGGPLQTSGNAACPVTAVFLSTLAGPEKASCQIPAGTYGSSRLTRWRLMGNVPAGGVTINEQFSAIDDPYNLIGAIQKGTYTTNNGLFDDCYSLAAKQPLPPDFVLKAEQNHLLNGTVISKNEVTFYADRIHFCSHHRLPQSCDFSARCSL